MNNPQNLLEVQVQIHIRQQQYGNGALSLNHNFTIKADGFDAIAKILLQYDNLSKAIQNADAMRR